jgi:multidrug efflux system membrane fusion protein
MPEETTPARPRTARVAALALVLPLAAGCGASSSSQAAPTAWPAPHVAVAAAAARDVPVYVDEIGKCAAREVVAVEPQVAGQVVEIHFKDGIELKKGDPLFTIDPRPYEARLEGAEATLAQSRALLELRGLEFDRARGLLGTRAIAKQDYDARENALKVAEAQVQAGLAALAQARLDLEYTSIRAPIDGRAGRRLVDVGNVVSPSDKAPLLSIQRLDPIYAEFTIAEADLARVRKSLGAGPVAVEVRSPDDPDLMRPGELTFIDNAVQDGTGTVWLRATVPNEDRRLWPGQFVRVRVILEVLRGAVLVPAGAVQVGQAGPFLYVLKADSTVEQRAVALGQRQGDAVVVAEKLAAGEKVVTAGQLMLYPGAHVEASEEPAPPDAPRGAAKEPRE